MPPYSLAFDGDADEMFCKLDRSVRLAVAKKLVQMQRDDKRARHLEHGSPYFVEEVGQYRICFRLVEKDKHKQVLFVGDHKEYEKWLGKR